MIARARNLLIAVGIAALCAGCDRAALPAWLARALGEPADESVRMEPLPVQQARAYPETVTGDFLPLVDFEDSADGRSGYEQAAHFSVQPARAGAAPRFVVNPTRTGAGALEVNLPAGADLVYLLSDIHDLRGYTLLSLAVHSPALRDDLQIALTAEGRTWRSHRTLVQPGWNTVLIDIQRLQDSRVFDISDVQTIRLSLSDAAGPVRLALDDIIVINNRRELGPSPEGLTLTKTGLNYEVTFADGRAAMSLSQSPDGLWRLGDRQPAVRVAPPGGQLPDTGEDLSLLGPRRTGRVELLEVNPVRIRLASAWYFPDRSGEWASMSVRGIRWEHTIYADGRCVTNAELNNAGGPGIGAVRLAAPSPVAWAGAGVRDQVTVRPFADPVARWSYLSVSGGATGSAADDYLQPARILPELAGTAAPAEGDRDKDGFDESQGCYFLRARSGHCRFTVVPPEGGSVNPVFRVKGGWVGPVSVNREGLAVRDVARTQDGDVLFMLRGRLARPTAVEVTGPVSRLAGRKARAKGFVGGSDDGIIPRRRTGAVCPVARDG